MPATLHDREQGFEAKFAHDKTLRFVVLARRHRLFARRAAATLELPDDKAEAMVKAVLARPDGRGHDQALLRHIAGILSSQGRRPPPGANAGKVAANAGSALV